MDAVRLTHTVCEELPAAPRGASLPPPPSSLEISFRVQRRGCDAHVVVFPVFFNMTLPVFASAVVLAFACRPSSSLYVQRRIHHASRALPGMGITAVEPMLSGLNGKALQVEMDDVPSKAEVRAVVPDHCYTRQTGRSLIYLAQSLIGTAGCTILGIAALPLKLGLPFWCFYATLTGTVAMGNWVLAHECGHGAFSDNRRLQDAIGFFLHSALLVPYFSWQRTHSVHHARTNHIYEGETHVPTVVDAIPGEMSTGGEVQMQLAARMGKVLHGAYQCFGHLTIGWPTYLLFGLTGGGKYVDASGRISNHFWPFKPFSSVMWPNRWPVKVFQSSVGVAACLAALGFWASRAGAATVMALYGGPLLVVNAWLIVYTWLQHTVRMQRIDRTRH